MKNRLKISAAALGLLLGIALLLHSTHAIQLIGLAGAGLDGRGMDKKTTSEDGLPKLADLHHHSDKSPSLKHAGDLSLYADGRSLRLLNERYRDDSRHNRGLGWLQQWWRVHGLHLKT